MYDLTRPLEGDATLEILTTKSPRSAPGVSALDRAPAGGGGAGAVPGNEAGHRSAHRDRLLLRFQRATKFTPEDLEKIEAQDARNCRRSNLPFERKLTPKQDGLEKYKDDWMKHELIAERAGEIFTEYTLGPHFIDFCRGPHVPSTEKLKAFKLLSIAGAYWKGSEKNPQLQRIYGTAFFTKKELDEYLNELEEAKRRDHRKLGKELELFTVNELVGAGCRSGCRRARPSADCWRSTSWNASERRGYSARLHAAIWRKVELYQRSGHWEHLSRRHVPADGARDASAWCCGR